MSRKEMLHKIAALEAKRDAIPGEPCGSPAYCCDNPRHMEYFDLTTEILWLEYKAGIGSKPWEPGD